LRQIGHLTVRAAYFYISLPYIIAARTAGTNMNAEIASLSTDVFKVKMNHRVNVYVEGNFVRKMSSEHTNKHTTALPGLDRTVVSKILLTYLVSVY